MKKEIIIRGMLLVAMLFVLCNHNVCAQKDIYGGEVKLTDAEEYALKKPGLRASGKGVSSREAAALSRARLEARAAFAEAIASSVLSAAKASGFEAKDSIVLRFDNSLITTSDVDASGKNKQIMAIVTFTYIKDNAVEKVSVNVPYPANQAIYDMSGRRVGANARGLLIIGNKKVLVK